MHAGFKPRPAAAVTRPLMVHRDVEGVEAFMGATFVSRRHSAAEIALKNFEIPTLVPSTTLLSLGKL